MKTFEEKLQKLTGEANMVIADFMKAHNGEYAPYKLADIYEEDDEAIDAEFQGETFEFLGATQYNTNEDLYFLSIKKDEYRLKIYAVTEFGSDVVVDISDMDTETICQLADYLNSLIILRMPATV